MTINQPNLPGNSHKEKLAAEEKKEPIPLANVQPERKTVGKVVTGTIVRKKKPWWDSFAETFFGGDVKSVGSYVFWDVLVPAAKNTIADMVNKGIDMALYGGTSRETDHLRRDRGVSKFSYNSIYNRGRPDRSAERREPLHNRSSERFNDIIIPNRREAEVVLDSLLEQIDIYGAATLLNFYDLVGIEAEFTDEKYGWENLRSATVRPARGGWIVDLPRPIELS